MKRKISLLIKTILFLLIFAAVMAVVMVVVERKSSYEKSRLFIDEAKAGRVDVLLFGSSHVINGVDPVQIYDEYGITAYNLGGYGSVLPTSYWQLMLALQYCQPKMVLIDTYMLEDDVRYMDDPGANAAFDQIHLNMDVFPLSKVKIAAVNDLFQDQKVRNQFLFDFIVYHDRWQELDKNDWGRLTGDTEINLRLGADMLYTIHSNEFQQVYCDPDAVLDNETVGTQYLRKMIEECQSRGIAVAAMTVPFHAMEIDQKAANTGEKIAEEYGIPYINMLKVPDLIDLNLDMSDDGHMNVSGAQKTTAYLGKWLSENTDLEDHINDPAYANWMLCSSEKYYEMQDMSAEQNDLYTQLMMMKMTGKSGIVFVRAGTTAYSDQIFIRLMEQLAGTTGISTSAADGQSYLLMVDHGNVYEYEGLGDTQTIDSSIGTLEYQPMADEYRVLTVEGEDTNYLYDDSKPYADVYVLLFDENGDGIEHRQIYSCEGFPYSYFSR